MALSKSEYFKNLFSTITQSTGAIVNAQSPEEMRAFVRAAKIDAAINVRNWNKFIHPMMKTLRSAPEHEQDVLEHGIHGGTVTTDLYATEDSMECLWDFTRGQPQSILGSILCLSARIANLASETVVEEYDDSDLRSLIKCIELNLEQARKDLFADCYIWDCDGNPNLPYSLGRHIYEMFNQVIIGAPAIGLEGCFDDDYPTLSIENRVSTLIYDDFIPSEFVEYCVEGRSIFDALQATQTYLGMDDCFDELPDYSLKTPLPPSVGNNVLGDGDPITSGMKALDLHMLFWSKINAVAAGGLITGDAAVQADGTGLKLDLVAGAGIHLDFGDAPPGGPGNDVITIGLDLNSLPGECCPLQDSYDAGAASTAGMIHLDGGYPEGGTLSIRNSLSTALTTDLFEVLSWEYPAAGGGIGGLLKSPIFQSGRHPLYLSGLGTPAGELQSTGVPAGPSSFQSYRNDGWKHPLYLHPVSGDLVPDTSGPGHFNAADPGFTYSEPEGAIFVGSGNGPIPDRDGQPIRFGGLYYREPSGGDIWNLLCCGAGGGGAPLNLGQTYNVDSSGNALPDGGRINLEMNADFPAGIHIYDNVSEVHNSGPWLTGLYGNPLLAVGMSSQANDADVHFSISKNAQIPEMSVNNHLSPVNFSIRDSDPLTPAHQGSLYCKIDPTTTHPHIHWRDPNNGSIYDLTATGGGGGGALEAWRTIGIATDGSAVGASVSGATMSGLVPQDMVSNLVAVAGDYINIDAVEQGVGLSDFLTWSVNPMPTTFLSDVSSVPAAMDGEFLVWDVGTGEYHPGNMLSVGTGANVYAGYGPAAKDHLFRSLLSVGSHTSALNINQSPTEIAFELVPDQIDVGDLGDVSSSPANNGDLLRWNSGSSEWVPTPLTLPPTPLGNVDQWLSAVEWDQRAESVNGDLNGPNHGASHDGLHFENNVHRGKIYVPVASGGTSDEWMAYNSVPFVFNNALVWDDQLTYASTHLPRVPDGGGGWIYPTKVTATGIFLSSPRQGSYQPGDRVTYRLSLSDNGTPGQVAPWLDGQSLASPNISFPGGLGVNGTSEVTSTDILSDYQVTVIEFEDIVLSNPGNGLLSFRITPVAGQGYFNQDDVRHHFLGLRLDYS